MFLIFTEVEWAAGYAWSTDVGKDATTNGGRGHQQTENDGPTIAAHVKVHNLLYFIKAFDRVLILLMIFESKYINK